MSVGVIVLVVLLIAPLVAWVIRQQVTKERTPEDRHDRPPRPKHRWWQP
jgi:hypothetical protein